MFVVICYLNAIRCIWTNFSDVISITLGGWLLSPKQLQLAQCCDDEMDFLVLLELWLYIDGLVSPFLRLFAIQSCFLTFIKVLVNGT